MIDGDTAQNHYTLLRVKPTASVQDIRRAYRDLSKLYHPDTTTLPPEVATEKFKVLNEAYATLSNPEKRLAYDYSIGISRVAVIQAPRYLNQPASQRSRYEKNNAYLDPTDRPLSPGELFALFILGLTFVSCLVLVFTIGWTKGELVLHSPGTETAKTLEQSTSEAPQPVAMPSSQPTDSAPPPAPAPPAPAPPARETVPIAPSQNSKPSSEGMPQLNHLSPSDFSPKII
jgi:hypothetical protein